jgi:hypothetical protein
MRRTTPTQSSTFSLVAHPPPPTSPPRRTAASRSTKLAPPRHSSSNTSLHFPSALDVDFDSDDDPTIAPGSSMLHAMPVASRPRLHARRTTATSIPQPSRSHTVVASPAPIPIADDDDGIVFLTTVTSATPAKRTQADISPLAPRPPLSPIKGASNAPAVNRPTKRKPAPIASSLSTTPVAPQGTQVTPLRTANGTLFDRLAPLAAPAFDSSERTPQTREQADGLLKTQTRTMQGLKIVNASDEENDSILEAAVPAAVSPDGHVTKRRARSRPQSTDFNNGHYLLNSPVSWFTY